ncbi:MAG TPA: LptF/LptG family permease, partial [Pseudomonadales bacterium]|nr:LptF/LptG family permease [Pseudomonadales bacterium]
QVRGHWGREEAGFLHVNVIEPNGVLYGITQYLFDDKGELKEASFSDRAIYRDDYWVMYNVKKTYFEDEKTRIEVTPTQEWHTKLTPKILALLSSEPDYMSITGLLSYGRYLEKQGLSAGQYYLSFWRKILQPVSTIAMVFIAASFVFGPLRSVTMGQRVTTGVIVGLVFQYFQDFLGQISLVFSMPAFIAALIPVVICIVAAYLLLKRVR